ncbi:MAG: nickel pincer cofactor biosynthesis protein LarB [Methanohalobium sp.]|uniref:nickel pincer cofactor biosynthesis protein LarB n=1 Tax=Methanohalobium sp. TaxID=2837493 RepID=UPI00397B8568
MKLEDILIKIQKGEIDVDSAANEIHSMSYTEVSDIAKIDSHRMCRTGIPEAVLGEGKKPDDLVEIVKNQVDCAGRVLVTRVSDEQIEKLRLSFKPENVVWNERARIAVIHNGTQCPDTGGIIGILSAGTTDVGIAEEARMVASEMGCGVVTIYDVGVAGIHRLFPQISKLKESGVDVVIVAAGREGTLPTIVSGLIDAPVIGLPVSTGYGAGGSGQAALMSMLQSCSVICVVNIDAGFVAGAFAAQIANKVAKARNK